MSIAYLVLDSMSTLATRVNRNAFNAPAGVKWRLEYKTTCPVDTAEQALDFSDAPQHPYPQHPYIRRGIMIRGQNTAFLALLIAYARLLLAQEQCGCEAEKQAALSTVTFTIVATVEPTITRWDQLLDRICPTPWPRDAYAGHHQPHQGHQHQDHEVEGLYRDNDLEDYEEYGVSNDYGCQIQYLDAFVGSPFHRRPGFPRPPHWIPWYPDPTGVPDPIATTTGTDIDPPFISSWSTGRFHYA